MKRHLALPAVGLAGIAGLMFAASAQGLPLPTITLSPSPSPSPTITESPSPEPETDGEVTADIYFEINYAIDAPDAPLTSEVAGVVVGDGVELEPENVYYDEGEFDYCTLPAVDIAADLSSVTVTGADDECGVQVAYLNITLHGAEFGTVTLGDDDLFQLPEFTAQLGPGAGKGGLGSTLRLGVFDDPPTLQDFGVSGSEFEAYWEGVGRGVMTGATTFGFAVDAGGADPVDGEPTFTG
jgi:hypothetical protein